MGSVSVEEWSQRMQRAFASLLLLVLLVVMMVVIWFVGSVVAGWFDC